MPSTRSGAKTGIQDTTAPPKPRARNAGGSKRKHDVVAAEANGKHEEDSRKGQQAPSEDADVLKSGEEPEKDDAGTEEPPTKSAKLEEASARASSLSNAQLKLDDLLKTYGRFPFSDYGLQNPEEATSSTVLAHLLNAMLTSARISHDLAAKAVKRLIEANYHDFEILEKSSWEKRTEVLTEGGYTRYRERTATQLGELVELIEDKYNGDLNSLREATKDDAEKVRDLVKEVKGIGDVGASIFYNTIQAIWPFMAPYVDPRNLETAKELGVGDDLQAMWKGVGEDPPKMAMLCAALTTVRLEKKQDEFKDDENNSEE